MFPQLVIMLDNFHDTKYGSGFEMPNVSSGYLGTTESIVLEKSDNVCFLNRRLLRKWRQLR